MPARSGEATGLSLDFGLRLVGFLAEYRTKTEIADRFGITTKTADRALRRLAGLGFRIKSEPRRHATHPKRWRIVGGWSTIWRIARAAED